MSASSRESTAIAPRAGVRARLAGAACQGFDRLFYRALRRIFLRQELPVSTPEELERALEISARYCAPENLADPDRLLAPRELLPRRPPAHTKAIRGGTFEHYRLPTIYRPIDPDYARDFHRYDGLETVHLMAWRHRKPAPVSILLLHGWGVGDRRIHEIEFNIGTLYRRLGLDVYFYIAPFHSLRKPSQARFSGELHPSVDIVRTNEAFIQTCQELRALMTMILADNPAPLGVMGSSLGGYTSALLASIDDRLDFAVPIIAPASLADLFWEHGGKETLRQQVEALGLTRERFMDAWALHSPLSYQPKVPFDRRLVVTASDDVLVTPRHVDALWEHWGRPRRFEFTGGHILQVGRGKYVDELGTWLRQLRLLPRAP
ncbi:MAG: alpha/beta hydrolase family protein [Myxococcales bacterium]|nr:alpha/beta hydrolase family protein [Myxococcales bacterium]MCB9704242.1 alpha/beta hydrolase family protein [Myxococcales bacterium]